MCVKEATPTLTIALRSDEGLLCFRFRLCCSILLFWPNELHCHTPFKFPIGWNCWIACVTFFVKLLQGDVEIVNRKIQNEAKKGHLYASLISLTWIRGAPLVHQVNCIHQRIISDNNRRNMHLHSRHDLCTCPQIHNCQATHTMDGLF